jgi:uncharacterized protein YdaU (DUF1376 family)
MSNIKDKYVTITVSGVITQIAEKTKTKGYSIGILEIFFPDNHENWSEKKCNKWIKENNERMQSICDFLNKNI